MILTERTLQFDFTGAIDAFKFDEPDPASATSHGLSHCMKAVDFVVEYSDHYLFVEIKDPKSLSRYNAPQDSAQLIKSLVGKFRDTFLYRWAEGKLDKPIRYLCLVDVDNAQTLYLMKQLRKELPVDKQPARWRQPLAQLCAITNRTTWNASFPHIQVARVDRGESGHF